ncbi:isocitrate/isopropylmalate dehydrogenase family protein [Micromonospora sp. DT233]|uniref:isocitrate/isopropylmalate dehydrogenase family protein n=1 Tax=Micromonospora sp. DT233 TaxID=3393432 RepID=UPI003CED7224
MTRRRIAVIPGDGIGPEIVQAAVQVLRALPGTDWEFHPEEAGAVHFRRTGAAMSPATLERLRTEYDAVLKGPVGLPEVRHPDGTEAGVVSGILRTGLNAYANVRPVTELTAEPRIDYVIVRENTEGLYASRGLGVGNDRVRVDQLLVTREGVERVVHYAFRLARTRCGAPADGVRRVTCVDKSNVLRSYAFFRSVFDEVARQYPDIEADHRYADAAGHDLVAAPEQFDVLVMENFIGDILSDVGAATVGGLGLCAAANIGDRHAYFEPMHGSAPTLAGTDRANPTGQILAAAMMLDHLGDHEAAGAIRRAVRHAYLTGAVQLRGAGSPAGGTRAAAAAVVAALRELDHRVT